MNNLDRKTQQVAEMLLLRDLLGIYPTQVLSIVSDTFNLWDVCTKYLPRLKKEIMARPGKLVIRPDSGDPVDILCGLNSTRYGNTYGGLEQDENGVSRYNSQNSPIKDENGKDGVPPNHPASKGVIELLWDVFGGTINEQGYKVLDSHIGAIYGDSITTERAEAICARLEAKGFASTNVVFGIGSYTYQYNTRDTFGFAMKATYVEKTISMGNDFEGNPMLETQGHEIFKDPITDDGLKKSAKGLIKVILRNDGYSLVDQCTWEQVRSVDNELKIVFLDGKLTNEVTLTQVRDNVNKLV